MLHLWHHLLLTLSIVLLLKISHGLNPSSKKLVPSTRQNSIPDKLVPLPLHRMTRDIQDDRQNTKHHQHKQRHRHHHNHHLHRHGHHHEFQTIDEPGSLSQSRNKEIPHSGEVEDRKEIQKMVTSLKVIQEQLHGKTRRLENGEKDPPDQEPLKVNEEKISMKLKSSSKPVQSIGGIDVALEALDLYDTNRMNHVQLSAPKQSLSQTYDHLVEEEAKRKEKMDQFIKSFETNSQVQGERTTFKKTEHMSGEVMECPDCHGNRVCDQTTKMCRIPCGPGYPDCPYSEGCSREGFCSKTENIERNSENRDYSGPDDETTEGMAPNPNTIEVLQMNETRLSEQKIMPIVQNALDRLKTSLKNVFRDMIEEFGFSSVVVQKIE